MSYYGTVGEDSNYDSYSKLVAGVSTLLLATSNGDIDRAINEVLGITGRYLGADRCYFYQLSDDTRHLFRTHGWFAGGAGSESDQPGQLPLASFPFAQGCILRNESISVADIESLPHQAKPEKELLARRNIRSLGIVPLQYRGGVFGFIGVSAIRHSMEWDHESLELLRITGTLIIGALMRSNAELMVELGQQLTEHLQESSPLNKALSWALDAMLLISRMPAGGIYLLDPEGSYLDLMASRGIDETSGDKGRHYKAGSASYRFLLPKRPCFYGISEKPLADNRYFMKERPVTLAVIPVVFREQFIGSFMLASQTEEFLPLHVRNRLEHLALDFGNAVFLLGKKYECKTEDIRSRQPAGRRFGKHSFQ